MHLARIRGRLGALAHAVVAKPCGHAQPIVVENAPAPFGLDVTMRFQIAPVAYGFFIAQERERQDFPRLGEEAVRNWRNLEAHRDIQAEGRRRIFDDYRLRVAEVLRDYGMRERAQAPADSREGHGREATGPRSEERRVGEECRSRWWPYHLKKKDI